MLAAVSRTARRTLYEMGYYSPQERRTAQLSARVPKSTKDGIESLARLWTHIERIQSGDPEAEVTAADVLNRLLQVGIQGAWDEIGMEPKTEADWAEVLKRAEKAFTGPRKK